MKRVFAAVLALCLCMAGAAMAQEEDAEEWRAGGRISGYGSRDVNRPSGSLRPVIWVTMGE